MSDSSMAYSQIQLEAIRQAISDGRLTAQQIHSILLEEITNELNKPKEEVDTEYISACQELLGSLNRSRTAAVVSHYEENLQAIRNKMQPRFSFSPCTGWKRIATAMCLALVFLCVGLFIPEGWIITHQTEDEGQYIMQGIETPAGFGSVADAGPALDHIGIYDTTSWQEVVHLMGGKPQVPHWLPSGWSILTYTVSLTDVSSGLTIIYLHDETGGSLLFQSTTFFDLSSLYSYIEQNSEGVVTELADGTKVYITDNIDNATATWHSTHSTYLLSGDVTKDKLVRIVDSME